jgi:hypothetical protein
MASVSEDITQAPPEVLATLAFIPAIPPPDGITSNFMDPYTEAPTQIIVTSVVLGLALPFFLNRVYVKLCLMKKLSWDDATLAFALVSLTQLSNEAILISVRSEA